MAPEPLRAASKRCKENKTIHAFIGEIFSVRNAFFREQMETTHATSDNFIEPALFLLQNPLSQSNLS